MKLDLDIAWATSSEDPQPAWILCRGLHQFPIADDAMLHCWAQRGRIQPDDYLVNPHLDACRQAKEMPALEMILLKNKVGPLHTICHLFALGITAIRSLTGDGETACADR